MKTHLCSVCLALFACQFVGGQAFLRRDFPVGDRPSSVVIGDFNGDSRADLN